MIISIGMFTFLFRKLLYRGNSERFRSRFGLSSIASAWNHGPIVVGQFLVAGAGGTFGFIAMVERVDRRHNRQVISSETVSPPASC